MTDDRSGDTVVVTGLGAVTPLGATAKDTWSALLAGRGAVAALDEPWAAELPVRIAARAAAEPGELLDRVLARRVDRVGAFGLAAVREAWADAGHTGPAGTPGAPDPERVAVVLGTGIGGVHTVVHNHEELRTRGARRVSPHAVAMLMGNHTAALAALEVNARAQASAPATACAAGADAIATALDLIRLGRADVVVAGGADSGVHPLVAAAFASMRALSGRHDEPHRASRPFDRDRDGFVLGEGAGVLVLESERHARARGAHRYAVLAGAGLASEAHHPTGPRPDGGGPAAARRRALADARLDPAAVRHVQAHATSTPAGDAAEAAALRTVFGPDAVPVSAIKSMTGHLLGAAGGLAAVAAVLSLSDGVVPPTLNLEHPEEGLGLDVVRDTPRELPAGPAAVLCNASGFGGHNVSLAFTRSTR
ncbi:beta-ketoacyl-[acyl-carrier-protein] synthase family protein [Kitasatospora sp. NPDC048545]|uniref:beta-ketoacyl-[acyl-carrier-protein] synthase family protein n=1 Tax=Kitasatospora sp. NPDC048545 TaxID=3157208 RepID=UPI0033E3D38C